MKKNICERFHLFWMSYCYLWRSWQDFGLCAPPTRWAAHRGFCWSCGSFPVCFFYGGLGLNENQRGSCDKNVLFKAILEHLFPSHLYCPLLCDTFLFKVCGKFYFVSWEGYNTKILRPQLLKRVYHQVCTALCGVDLILHVSPHLYALTIHS